MKDLIEGFFFYHCEELRQFLYISIFCGIWFWNCLCFMRWHAWNFSFSLSLTFLCSCWKGCICALRYWEHKLVDCRRRGDSPPRGHHHHFHPILETVSHRQAGVPARRHDLYSAETEGRVKPFILLFFLFLHFQLNWMARRWNYCSYEDIWHNMDEIIDQY